jgi:uncharacterized membrane protein
MKHKHIKNILICVISVLLIGSIFFMPLFQSILSKNAWKQGAVL